MHRTARSTGAGTLSRGAWAAAVLLSGCAFMTPEIVLPGATEVRASGAVFKVQFEAQDARVARDVGAALEAAVPIVERWGRFTAPVTVRIHPSHEALEAAVRRFNYPWLRAWARYDTVDLQSPQTWSLLGATQAQLAELLTHEITHCLMYQRAASAGDWARKGIPLWFREGMASVTAKQGYRRPTDEEVWRYLRAHPDRDPVGDPEDLYQGESDIVYGAAHRAFEFLLARYGDESVRVIMEEMKHGVGFNAAFTRAIGLAPVAFAREYVRYVRLEGWRGDERTAASVPMPLVPVTGAAGDARQ